MTTRTLHTIPMCTLIMVCFWIASTWIFARFVHYHAQRQLLSPAHYTADVIAVTGGANEREPFADFKKSEDGLYYVRVATLGTAHHIRRTTSDLIIPFILSLSGIVIATWIQSKQKTAKQ